MIDSAEDQQLNDGASCLYLRLCRASSVDIREERKGRWKYVLGQTTTQTKAEMAQQLCRHEKRKVAQGWVQKLIEIGLIEYLVTSENKSLVWDRASCQHVSPAAWVRHVGVYPKNNPIAENCPTDTKFA